MEVFIIRAPAQEDTERLKPLHTNAGKWAHVHFEGAPFIDEGKRLRYAPSLEASKLDKAFAQLVVTWQQVFLGFSWHAWLRNECRVLTE